MSDDILMRKERSAGEGTMKMELVSRETIKPSAPTPPHLRIYPLSFLDHISFRNYVPLVYFYPNEGYERDDSDDAPSKVCDQSSKILMLKESLSEVLTRYYPLAGRFRDQLSIDCNDQGASLLVTRIRGKLSGLLQNPSEALLNPLFPDELQWKDMAATASIVAIQITCFACGGMAISVCMSHKVGDASTLVNFVNDWATLNRKSSEEGEPTFPVFDAGASVFSLGNMLVFPEIVFVRDNTVCRRFVFEASKVEALKAMVASHRVENPTRVQVVTALIYKCAVSALRLTARTASFRLSVNLRTRMAPSLPDKSIGNMVWSFLVSSRKKEEELHDLVRKTKEGFSELCDRCAENHGGKELLSFISKCLKQAASTSVSSDRENQTLFRCASWCRFPMYEVDFGWGKPIWVTTSGCPARNSIVLMDARDGDGIEALVNMTEQDMAMFENDVEFLQYASLNPPVGHADGL